MSIEKDSPPKRTAGPHYSLPQMPLGRHSTTPKSGTTRHERASGGMLWDYMKTCPFSCLSSRFVGAWQRMEGAWGLDHRDVLEWLTTIGGRGGGG